MVKILLRGFMVGVLVLFLVGVVELVALAPTPLVISVAAVVLMGVGIAIGWVFKARYRIVANASTE